MALEVTRNDHRTLAITVVAHDRVTSDSADDAQTARSLLHPSATAPRETAHARACLSADLHDDILRDLSEDLRRRMRNWARSLDGGSVTTCSQLWGNAGRGHRAAAVIPVLMGEAKDTDKIVRRLPEREQECIAIFWTYEARDIWWMCQATERVRAWALTPERFVAYCHDGHSLLVVALQLSKR